MEKNWKCKLVTGGTVGTGSVVGGIGAGSTGGHSGPGLGSGTSCRER